MPVIPTQQSSKFTNKLGNVIVLQYIVFCWSLVFFFIHPTKLGFKNGHMYVSLDSGGEFPCQTVYLKLGQVSVKNVLLKTLKSCLVLIV